MIDLPVDQLQEKVYPSHTYLHSQLVNRTQCELFKITCTFKVISQVYLLQILLSALAEKKMMNGITIPL